jgi:hypothetical protein
MGFHVKAIKWWRRSIGGNLGNRYLPEKAKKMGGQCRKSEKMNEEQGLVKWLFGPK